MGNNGDPPTHKTGRQDWGTTNLDGNSTRKLFLALWERRRKNFSPNVFIPKLLRFEWRVRTIPFSLKQHM